MIAGFDLAGGELKRWGRDQIRKVAEPVRDDARLKLTEGVARSPSIQRTATGFTIYVRRVGVVSVEQRLRKTTGLHPEFGTFQMRHALIPALDEKTVEVTRRFDEAITKITEKTLGGNVV